MRRAFLMVFILCLAGSVSGQQYFPDHAFYSDEHRNQFVVEWYSKPLKALGEPSFWELSQRSHQQLYRFLWLRSFSHPVAVRLELRPDGSAILTIQTTDGAGGYAPGRLIENRERTISAEQMKWFLQRVDELKYWNLPTEEPRGKSLGLDGAQWILEASRSGRYKIVDRWSPRDGPIRALGLEMMIELADMPLLYKEVY